MEMARLTRIEEKNYRMGDKEFDELVEHIYRELRIEYGLDEPRETVYPLPNAPIQQTASNPLLFPQYNL